MTRQTHPAVAFSEPANIVVLRGRLAASVTSRERVSGTWSEGSLHTVSVEPTGTVREVVPIVWSGEPDRFVDAVADADLVVTGRVRQRFFRSGGSVVSRTEVVVDSVVSARRRAAVRRLVEGISESLVLAVGSARG